jgi:hypothetical protein
MLTGKHNSANKTSFVPLRPSDRQRARHNQSAIIDLFFVNLG